MAKINNSVTAIDQSAIPRPLNCFLMYRLEKQKEIVAKCSGANHRDISKIIAKWWQEASEEEKRPFRERAHIAKAEHRKLYPDYKYTPKKKMTPKRVYVRKNKKEQFTSRASENNKIMEMIYEDPSALENIDGVEYAAKKSSIQKSNNKFTKKNTKVSKKRAANTVVMIENVYEDCSEDYSEADFEDYRASCQDASSVSSTQTVPDFYFDSPQAASPFTDCYSESDMQSPYAESSPLYDFQLSHPMVSSSAPVASAAEPFNLLDTPFINSFNAYSPIPLESQLDYFQFDPTSNINLNINPNITTTRNNNNYPQEFWWNECPVYMFTQECQNSIMMQTSQLVQFIDPSILHNM